MPETEPEQKREKRKATYADAFADLGVELYEDGDQTRGDCPLCGKEGHFFLKPDTGQWDCKVCGESGNFITFMTRAAKKAASEIHPKDLARLAKMRGLPPEALKGWSVGYTGTEWWLPCFSNTGTVRDIRRFVKGKLWSPAMARLQLFNFPAALAAPKGATIWICEGEWDCIALQWLLRKAGRAGDVCVGVPGAAIFKDDWVAYFAGKHVRVVYDNDVAGENGMIKVDRKLGKTAASKAFVWWPPDFDQGWDIRDTVLDGIGKDISAAEGVKAIEAMLHPRLRSTPGAAGGSSQKIGAAALSGGNPADEPLPPPASNEPMTFGEVLDTFKKWCFVDKTFEDALAACLATCLADEVAGDPLWLYLVGPASSGKSIILTALSGSDRVIFHSSLTPKSLVSGFNVQPDPSLLPTFDGKTAVFKDGTELLSAHPESRRETFGILRGAYDGRVDREYGNGVKRNYVLHFGMLMGVTDAIHGENNATMGERFLKFQMPENPRTVEGKIRAAIEFISKEVKRDKELADACRRFLLKRMDPEALPEVPEWVTARVIGLSQILGKLRAQVAREAYDREMSYRPTTEVGIRAAKQLIKAAQMLCGVFGTTTVGEKEFGIVLKLAEDSAIGFHIDIVRAIAENPDGLTSKEITELTRIPSTTLSRRLEDLAQLDIIYRIEADREDLRPTVAGHLPAMWKLTKSMRSLWRQAYALPDPDQPAQKPSKNGHRNGNGKH